jgi:uncharacterized protein RhaS with RHS repeats
MTKCNWTIAVLAAALPLILGSTAEARFLQTDPVGYSADQNLYTYVGNDPTDKTDPKGTDPSDYLPPGYYQYGPIIATTGEANGAIQGARAIPGVMLNVALDSAPVIGEGRAVINFYNDPTVVNAIIVGASLADLGGAVKVAGDIGRLERGALSLEKNAADHEARAAEFEANPTVKSEMTGQSSDVIAKQQAARVAHLRQEAAEFRKQATERRALADELKKKLQE